MAGQRIIQINTILSGSCVRSPDSTRVAGTTEKVFLQLLRNICRHFQGGKATTISEIMPEAPIPSPKMDISASDSTKLIPVNVGKPRTYASLGFPNVPLPTTELVASKPRVEWLETLRRDGYEGLLMLKMSSLNGVEGFNLSWWAENRNSIDKDVVTTPFGENDPAAILTLQQGFTVNSMLSTVACTISELIGSDSDEQYCVSAPQLILPSEKGFCQDFRWDFNSRVECYRCFWYLGTHHEESGKDEGFEPEPARVQKVFIGSAGESMKAFGDQFALTLEAYFGEANRKFVLHSGDILVMRSNFPFAIDPALGDRGIGSRVLSWQVMPKRDRSTLPAVMPKLVVVKNIEDVAARNEEAMRYYKRELESFLQNSGHIGDQEGNMERLRVTPNRFEEAIIYDHAKCNSSILPVDSTYFS